MMAMHSCSPTVAEPSTMIQLDQANLCAGVCVQCRVQWHSIVTQSSTHFPSILGRGQVIARAVCNSEHDIITLAAIQKEAVLIMFNN